ncbi:MAG: hypothetical protein L0Y60_12305 [Beijerinckiaceae bacterium]|nr:hypothetical protein [Beijerinckiaceae bacterium]
MMSTSKMTIRRNVILLKLIDLASVRDVDMHEWQAPTVSSSHLNVPQTGKLRLHHELNPSA